MAWTEAQLAKLGGKVKTAPSKNDAAHTVKLVNIWVEFRGCLELHQVPESQPEIIAIWKQHQVPAPKSKVGK